MQITIVMTTISNANIIINNSTKFNNISEFPTPLATLKNVLITIIIVFLCFRLLLYSISRLICTIFNISFSLHLLFLSSFCSMLFICGNCENKMINTKFLQLIDQIFNDFQNGNFWSRPLAKYAILSLSDSSPLKLHANVINFSSH